MVDNFRFFLLNMYYVVEIQVASSFCRCIYRTHRVVLVTCQNIRRYIRVAFYLDILLSPLTSLIRALKTRQDASA